MKRRQARDRVVGRRVSVLCEDGSKHQKRSSAQQLKLQESTAGKLRVWLAGSLTHLSSASRLALSGTETRCLFTKCSKLVCSCLVSGWLRC